MEPVKIALREYFTKEIVGSEDNQRVLEYFKTVGHSWVKDDETAWCAAFIGFCLEKSGLESTKSLSARSYERWGEETTYPVLGDLAVFWRENKNGQLGHVGFYINEDQNYIRVLSGNQSNKVCIEEYPKSRLLCFRRVNKVENVVNIPKTLLGNIKTLLDELSKYL